MNPVHTHWKRLEIDENFIICSINDQIHDHFGINVWRINSPDKLHLDLDFGNHEISGMKLIESKLIVIQQSDPQIVINVINLDTGEWIQKFEYENRKDVMSHHQIISSDKIIQEINIWFLQLEYQNRIHNRFQFNKFQLIGLVFE